MRRAARTAPIAAAGRARTRFGEPCPVREGLVQRIARAEDVLSQLRKDDSPSSLDEFEER